MDDELKRQIAASLDLPEGAVASPAVMAALESDPQAREFARGLYVIEKALSRWPLPVRSAAEWERMAVDIERRLGDAPWEAAEGSTGTISWDPLDSPPLREEPSGAGKFLEHKAMAMSHDENQNDDDLEGLAALTRTSSAPTSTSIAPPPVRPSLKPGPALGEDAMDESSGIVDIKQLAAIALRQSAPPPASSLAPTSADTTGRADTAVLASDPLPAERAEALAKTQAVAKTAVDTPPATAASEAAPVSAATPAPATLAEGAKKKSSGWIWLLPALAAAGIGGWYVTNTQSVSQRSAATAPSGAGSSTETPLSARAEAPALPAAAPPAAQTQALNEVRAAAPIAPAPPGEAAAQPASAAPATPPAPNAAPTRAAEPSAVSTNTMLAANTHAQEHANRAVAAESETTAPNERSSTSARVQARATESATPSANESVAAQRPTGASTSANGALVARAAPAPAATAPASAPAAAAPAAPAQAQRPRSIDDLMAQATGGNRSGPSGGTQDNSAAAQADLPDRPSQNQVRQTLAPLAGAVRACTQGATGMATISMVIVSDGSVQSARVSGPFTPAVNSCIEGVVRRAHFPAFRRPSVPIVYPFSIQPRQPGGAE